MRKWCPHASSFIFYQIIIKVAVSAFFQSSLIKSLSNLQIKGTCIKSRMNSNLDWVRLFTMELFALECSHWLWIGKMMSIFSQLIWIQSSSNLQEMRAGIKSQMSLNFVVSYWSFWHWAVKKWCLQLFPLSFYWIFVKLEDNRDWYKSSNELEFWPDRIICFGVICPWAQIFFPIDLYWRKWWSVEKRKNSGFLGNCLVVIYDWN